MSLKELGYRLIENPDLLPRRARRMASIVLFVSILLFPETFQRLLVDWSDRMSAEWLEQFHKSFEGAKR